MRARPSRCGARRGRPRSGRRRRGPGRHDRRADRAGVERVAAARRDRLERVREPREAHDLAAARRGAVGTQVGGGRGEASRRAGRGTRRRSGRASPASGKPSRARSIAGRRRSENGSRPKRAWAWAHPSTAPGTGRAPRAARAGRSRARRRRRRPRASPPAAARPEALRTCWVPVAASWTSQNASPPTPVMCGVDDAERGVDRDHRVDGAAAAGEHAERPANPEASSCGAATAARRARKGRR